MKSDYDTDTADKQVWLFVIGFSVIMLLSGILGWIILDTPSDDINYICYEQKISSLTFEQYKKCEQVIDTRGIINY